MTEDEICGKMTSDYLMTGLLWVSCSKSRSSGPHKYIFICFLDLLPWLHWENGRENLDQWESIGLCYLFFPTHYITSHCGRLWKKKTTTRCHTHEHKQKNPLPPSSMVKVTFYEQWLQRAADWIWLSLEQVMQQWNVIKNVIISNKI